MSTLLENDRAALPRIRRFVQFALGAIIGVLYATIAVTLSATAVVVGAPAITRTPANPTNSQSAIFGFTVPVGAGSLCRLDAGTFVPCASPTSFTGLGEGVHTFAVKAVKGTSQSAASTYAWLVDLTPPPAPLFTAIPSNPTANTNTFAWTDAETGVAFECSLDGERWLPCSSPFRYRIAEGQYGPHEFAVRAVDAAGNRSTAASYRFELRRGRGVTVLPFTISGDITDLDIGVPRALRLRLSNPNQVPITVTHLAVAISADSSPSGCRTAGNIRLTQSSISAEHGVTLPARGSVTLPAQGVTAPQVLLLDLATVNQDVCKNKTFTFTFSGTATN